MVYIFTLHHFTIDKDICLKQIKAFTNITTKYIKCLKSNKGNIFACLGQEYANMIDGHKKYGIFSSENHLSKTKVT